MADEQVTAAEIARLAGVGRAAVSNWRRRHEDTFPKPVGGQPTSPTFSRAEVEAWLAANGRAQPEQARHETHATGADLAHVVTSLLPPTPAVILDPACDGGVLLAAAARRFGPSVAYVGQDLDATKVPVARAALAGAGVKPDGLAIGSPFVDDALARYRGAADAVLCLPPSRAAWTTEEPGMRDLRWAFSPPSQLDPYLAWLQACYGYVKPGGIAVVPMPPAAAVRASGRRVRAEMLRAGALRQVVALPERFAAHLAGPWQIWVLSRPADRPQYTVRMVDLTGLPREDVPTDDAGWRRIYRDPASCREVEAIELLDEDILLLPSRHVEAPVRDVAPEYDKLRGDLSKAVTALDVKLPALPRGRGGTAEKLVSITELARRGDLTFVDKGGSIQPGDVVVPAGADRAASVVGADGAIWSAPGEVLRCDPEAIDPYFLALFLRSESNRRHASGTIGGTARLDLRRARIPDLSIVEQRAYGLAFRQLSDVIDRIDGLHALASQAVQAAAYGLTTGTLAPPRAARSR